MAKQIQVLNIKSAILVFRPLDKFPNVYYHNIQVPRKKVALPNQIEFEWDKGNLNKNKLKHNVEWTECEELFFNKPLVVGEDPSHSTKKEERYQALGKTNNQRLLFIAFTIRNEKVRVISARDQNKKERTIYGGGEKK